MPYDTIAIHFGEIWLKGRNRGWFIRRLYKNVAAALQDEEYDRLENDRDRFMLLLNSRSNIKSINERLGKVFGVSWFSPVAVSDNTIAGIISKSKELVAEAGVAGPLKVVPSRSYKGLGYTSVELVSGFFKKREALGFELDKNAEQKLLINVRKDDALISLGKMRGGGGLPVGSSGKAVVLLSGGIDSPVASFYAMKRGFEPIYLHVHGFAENSKAENSKMRELLGALAGYYADSKAYYAPAHIFQGAVMRTPKSKELVLFKHFIYKLAEKVAKREGALTIVTGESLGQVASQTVKNLIATQYGVKPLIFRPLIGFDKEEIISAARKLGTYEISIIEYPDVCSMKARHPDTSADPKEVRRLYKESKLDNVLKETLKKSSIVHLRKLRA